MYSFRLKDCLGIFRQGNQVWEHGEFRQEFRS